MFELLPADHACAAEAHQFHEDGSGAYVCAVCQSRLVKNLDHAAMLAGSRQLTSSTYFR